MSDDKNVKSPLLSILLLIGCIGVAVAARVQGCKSNPAPAPTPVVEQPKPTPEIAIIDALLAMHNGARQAAGGQPLAMNKALMLAAGDQAKWMADNKMMSHDRPGGPNLPARVRNAGYFYRNAGENIAYGYRSVRTVMDGWMMSKGHRANILNPSYQDVGFGLAYDEKGVPYWCAVFGRPAAASATSTEEPEINAPPAIMADLDEIIDKPGVNVDE